MGRAGTQIRSILGAALLVGVIAIVVFLPPLAQWAEMNFYVRFATRVMIFAIAALSLDLVLGHGGMVSFGHAAFVGLSGYVVAILSYHATHEALILGPLSIAGSQNAFVVWPIAIALTALAAFVIGGISLRTTGLAFIMVTLAFAQMIYFLVLALRQYGGEEGLSLERRSILVGINLENRTTFYYFTLATLVACILISRQIVNSRFGRVLHGCRQNEPRMRSIGFQTYRYKLTAFVISGTMAGVAGILLVNNEAFISTADLDWFRSADLIIMVVLGGMGTLWGPILGAFVWMSTQLVLSSFTIHWLAIVGPALVIVVLFARQGLVNLALPIGRRSPD